MVLMKDYAHENNDRYTTKIYTTPKIENGEFITLIPDITVIIMAVVMVTAVWFVNDKEQLKYSIMGTLMIFMYAILIKFVGMAVHNKCINVQAVAHYRMAIQFYDGRLNGKLLASISVSDIKVKCNGLTIRVTDGSNTHEIICHSNREMNNLLKYMDKAVKDELPVRNWGF